MPHRSSPPHRIPQPVHGLRVADALDDEHRAAARAPHALPEHLFHKVGTAPVVQVQEVHRHTGLQEQLVQPGRRRIDGSFPRGLQVEGRGREPSGIDHRLRLGIVHQAEQQPLHLERFAPPAPGLPRRLPFFLFQQGCVFIIRCSLVDDARNEMESKRRMHPIAPPIAETGQPHERPSAQ